MNIKSYTDLEQSKKLAKFLPLESADMWYQHTGFSIKDGTEKLRYFPMVIRDYESDEDIPCWSLAALLSVLPKLHKLQHSEEGYYCSLANYKYITEAYNNPIDACYEMIIKLHELKML